MGYCQQQALALKLLYDRLEIESRLVYASKAKFPPKVVHGVSEGESISGHAWLRVRVGEEERDVDPGNVSNIPGKVHFTAISEVRTAPPLFQPFAHLCSVVANVVRDWRATKFKTLARGQR